MNLETALKNTTGKVPVNIGVWDDILGQVPISIQKIPKETGLRRNEKVAFFNPKTRIIYAVVGKSGKIGTRKPGEVELSMLDFTVLDLDFRKLINLRLLRRMTE